VGEFRSEATAVRGGLAVGLEWREGNKREQDDRRDYSWGEERAHSDGRLRRGVRQAC
jgi:hypothetical protein